MQLTDCFLQKKILLSFNRAQTSRQRLWIWQQVNSLRLQLLEKVSFFTIISIYFHIGLTVISHIPFSSVFLPRIVSQEQLDRAKEATKSAVLMNLESRVHCSCSWSNPNHMICFPKVFFTLHVFPFLQSIASEDIGRQVLTYGERYEEYCYTST